MSVGAAMTALACGRLRNSLGHPHRGAAHHAGAASVVTTARAMKSPRSLDAQAHALHDAARDGRPSGGSASARPRRRKRAWLAKVELRKLRAGGVISASGWRAPSAGLLGTDSAGGCQVGNGRGLVRERGGEELHSSEERMKPPSAKGAWRGRYEPRQPRACRPSARPPPQVVGAEGRRRDGVVAFRARRYCKAEAAGEHGRPRC